MSETVKEIRRMEQATVVEASGEIDLRTQPEFQSAIMSVCQERPAKLIVDLGGVSYMDSSGVGTLVKVSHAVKGYGGELLLVNPTERVRSIFEITTLDKYFTILGTEEEALAT
jgi:anti-sigma B factor antagonist